jgi:hypothetical protein
MAQGEIPPLPPRIDNVEIYIDEDGSVTITDLPAELLPLVESLQKALTHGQEDLPNGA